MDEYRAIQRLKHGDIGRLEWLVAQHYKKSTQTAFLITRDPQLAQDNVQNASLKVYQSIASFKELMLNLIPAENHIGQLPVSLHL